MSTAGRLAVLWGLLGTLGILGESIVRLAGHVLAAVETGLSARQWALLLGWALVLMVVEGYRGFQRSFSPRVVARAWHLGRHPGLLTGLLAPLYCMGLVHASRRRLVGSWLVLASIVGLVLIIRTLEQPARGIVDAGVVAGLAWGLVATVIFTARALRGEVPAVSLELPDESRQVARLREERVDGPDRLR